MYNKSNYNNDFSILRLTSPVSFSSKISPVCLPSNVTDNFTGEVLFTLYFSDYASKVVLTIRLCLKTLTWSPMTGSHGHGLGIVGRSRQPDSGDLAGWVYKIVEDVITRSQITRSQGCKGCHHQSYLSGGEGDYHHKWCLQVCSVKILQEEHYWGNALCFINLSLLSKPFL